MNERLPWVDELYSEVHKLAQRNEDVELALRLGELREADNYEGELPTGYELAEILGVPREELV